MFAEFTQLDNWNYDFDANPHAYRFFELFDTTADPWQTTNIYYTNASTSMKKALHELVVSNFRCQRSECFKPIKFQLNEDGSNGLHAPVPTLDNLDFNRAWNSPSKSTEAFVTRPTGWVQPGTGICATGTDPDIVDGISCDGNLNAGGDTGSGGFSGTESLFQLGQSGFHDCE